MSIYYLTDGGVWKTEEQIILEAIDIVCGACDYTPEDVSGIDPCKGCKVVETAVRMHGRLSKEEA